MGVMYGETRGKDNSFTGGADATRSTPGHITDGVNATRSAPGPTDQSFGGTPRFGGGVCVMAWLPPAWCWGLFPLTGSLGELLELLWVADVDQPTCETPFVGVREGLRMDVGTHPR